MGSENIALTAEETGVFIDLWESQPALWDTRCESYKDRRARLAARKYIAEAMGRLWNEEQVERKILSLKGNYNNERRKLVEGLTKTGKGKTKKIWPHYDRLKSFLMVTEYDPEKHTVIEEHSKRLSPAPSEPATAALTTPSAQPNGEPLPRILVTAYATHQLPTLPRSETQHLIAPPDRGYELPALPKVEADPHLLLTTSRNHDHLPAPPKTESEPQLFVTTSGMDQLPSDSGSPVSSSLGPDSPPSPSSRSSPTLSKKQAVASSPLKRPAQGCLPECRAAVQLSELACWKQSLHSSSEQVFGMYVADCLGRIRCQRRRMVVRKKINDIFHEAIMEELSE